MKKYLIVFVVLLTGCVSPKWKKLAIMCGDVMNEAIPIIESCRSSHEKKYGGSFLQ